MIPHRLAVVAMTILLCLQDLRAQTPRIFELQNSLVDEQGLNFPVSPTTKFGTTINGRTHQQWPMQTFKGHQYATYYDHNRHVCVARRKLPAGAWEVIRFTDYQILSNDSHNVTVIGIAEGDGSIHLVFDHHADELKYRFTAPGAASNPESIAWNASLFSPVVHALGPVGEIDRFTYPRLVPMPNGNLLLYYRYFTSGNGDSVIREYDATTHQWKPGLGKFVARDIGTFTWDGATSSFRNAYLNAISYAGGRLHVSWVWRDRFAATSADNNHDICYAYSDDDGRTWNNNAGQQIAITGSSFISIDSPGIVVVPVAPQQDLINQCTHYACPDGSIHLVMRHYVAGTTTTRYHHHWRDAAGQWHSQALSFSGSRPSLVGDAQKNLLLVYTSSGRTRIAHGSPNAGATAWAWSSIFTQNAFGDGGEGVIDFSRWQEEGILSTYSQPASPDSLGTPTALRIFDYRFVSDASATPAFTTHPLDQAVSPGQPSSLSVSATGTSALAYRWQRLPVGSATWGDSTDNTTYSGSTTATLTINGATLAMNGDRFRCIVSYGGALPVESTAAMLTVALPPVIVTQPASSVATSGGSIALVVTATASGPLTYQWRLNGSAIAGATSATFTIPSVQLFHAGTYTVTVSSNGIATTSTGATVTVGAAPPSDARPLNLSTRALARPGDALIPGFVIEGAGSKRLLIRAVGPSLARLGVANPLSNPRLVLKRFDPVANAFVDVLANDDWSTATNAADIRSTAAAVGAFALDEGSTDAALLAELPPGRYTALANGASGTGGLSIVEVYDADPGATGSRLVNISNRGHVGVGANIMIPGFVVSPEGRRTFLIRAVGPTLTRYGVEDALVDPQLALFRGQERILSNDNWDTAPGAATSAAIATQVGAFALEAGSGDAALVATLEPGAYTVQASGVGDRTGEALVEVYLVP